MRDYQGWEFDDFLASPVVRALCINNLLLRRIWIQVGELLPWNVRRLLGVACLPSTKASGFIARAYLNMYRATGRAEWLARANERLAWLTRNASTGYPGIGWGNHFDFASRGGYYPKGLPTVVWTAHIAEAFDLSYEIQRRHGDIEVLQGCAKFVLEALERHVDSDGFCFAYAPGIMNEVHNSNLLGAVTLLRLYRYQPDSRLLETARGSISWSLNRREPDGGWRYGTGDRYRWIDSFHTAYVLDCLVRAHEIAGEDVVPRSVIDQTFRFWAGHFFAPDGTPHYYHDRKYPLDIQCASQAIETLSRLSRRHEEAGPLADRVLDWTRHHMKKANGLYRYQIRRFWKNDLESLHWGQATMLSALAVHRLYRGGSAAA